MNNRPLSLVPAVGALCLGSLLLGSCGDARRTVAPRTIAKARAEFLEETIRETIERPLAGPLTDSTEGAWERAFWAMGLTRYRSETTDRGLATALARFADRSVSFRRSLLEAVYGLNDDTYRPELWRVLGETREPKIFAMAALAVTRGTAGQSPEAVRALLHDRFPDWQSHPVLLMLDEDLAGAGAPVPATPPLVDLFRHSLEESPVLFSLQRKDRRYEGRVILRGADGQFARNADGSVFSVRQLALSAPGLPGYLTNGNTPEGIFSFQGFEETDNEFIGPTETIQLVLPYETPPGVFLHEATAGPWTVQMYAALLPSSWRSYIRIYEAYYAGAAGRTEIIAHGTTINPVYYQGEPFYPNTPSLGCLTAGETWSDFDGERLTSDQQLLVDALRNNSFTDGYCVVVNLDDRRERVSQEEVRALVDAAERALR